MTDLPDHSNGGVGQYARFWPRVGAHLVDLVLYGLPLSAFVTTAFVSLAHADQPDAPDDGIHVVGLVVGVVGMLSVTVIYLWVLGRSGQTWGRRIARVRVVRNHTGDPIGIGRALARQLFWFMTVAPLFGLGYLWMLWDDERQTLHDKVADTVVVAS
jgi:uncharacterized RDD family membrane protein YckC